MKDSELLKKAQKLIGTRRQWIKGTSVNSKGTAFCALGAMRTAAGPVVSLESAKSRLLPFISGKFVASFNDYPDTTHDDVMTMFDWAIAAAEYDEKHPGPEQ